MKAVAIVTNSLSGGGAERAMNLLADNLEKFDELNVLLIPINAGPRDLVNPSCEISEIRRVWNGGLWDTLKAFVRYQYVILKFKPEFLILNCDLPEFFSAFAFWKAKFIIVEHTTRPWAGRRTIGNLIRVILRARGASYLRVSERIRISPQFNSSTVIPNIIDSKIIDTQTEQSQVSKSHGKLIFVGRLSKEKRPDLFIELARVTGLESLIIGDGQLSFELRDDSKDIGNLKFLGQQLNPWQFTSNRDLLVLTSEYEGDGLVALEAISIGIPVALRSTSDLERIGFPLKNYFDDIPALAERIAKNQFNDFKLRDSERSRILSNRSPEEVSQLWLQFLLSLQRFA
jgi:glycosyltransferase involved in cell wall biosynthesis